MSTGIQISPSSSSSSDITVGTTPISSGTDGRVLFEDSGVVQQDADLHWDNTNKRLGVGTASPTEKLDVDGDIRFSGGTVENNSSTTTTLTIKSSAGLSDRTLIQQSPSRFSFSPDNGVEQFVINESGVDCDFRVEGDNDANLIFTDAGNDMVGIGTASPSAKLDVKAQGALSTDIAFRVRDSVHNSRNIFLVRGDNNVFNPATVWQDIDGSQDVSFRARASLSYFEINHTAYNNATEALKAATTMGKIAFTAVPSQNKFNFVNSAQYWGTGGVYSGGFHWYKSGVSGDPLVTRINSSVTNANRQMWLTPENSLLFFNTSGITYTTNVDSFQLYSADITAGNAAPHFRTESGDVIKLYKQTSTGTETVADVVQYLKNLGLLS